MKKSIKIKISLIIFALSLIIISYRIFKPIDLEKDNNHNVLIFYRKDCPDCIKIKKNIYWESFKDNKVWLINTRSKLGKTLVGKYGIKEVPTAFFIDTNNTIDPSLQNINKLYLLNRKNNRFKKHEFEQMKRGDYNRRNNHISKTRKNP